MILKRVREGGKSQGYPTHPVSGRDSTHKRMVDVRCGHLGRMRKKVRLSTSLLLATRVHRRSDHEYSAQKNKKTKTTDLVRMS
jgi:hypothetical protein